MRTHTSDGIETAVMRILCRRFRTDLSRRVLDILDKGLIREYLDLDIQPSLYEDSSMFAKDYLLYSFLRKWKGWEVGALKRESAISSWTTAERLNYASNRRLDDLSPLSREELAFISKVQLKVEKVLGASPDWCQLDHLCKWGPGATFDIRRSDDLDNQVKMLSSLTVTPRCLPHLQRVMDPIWSSVAVESPQVIAGNRCITVPKTAKTDRMIAAEPTANSFLQQGVGRFIRSRLKGFGIDLNDQTVNQDLAFRALVDGMSTIDLSMASDTLCRSLVHLLLPVDWCTYLEDLRSPYSFLDGKWYRLEKFSSMGNAFTFELESLIFWALCSVYCGEQGSSVRVYGDDIIVPRNLARNVISMLGFFGFQVNVDKSFVDGPFFESCGKHYHNLEDVTPVYQKEIVRKDLFELVRLHNRLYRWGLRNGLNLVKDAMQAVVDFTRQQHPKLKELPITPDCEGDFGFIIPSHNFKRDRHGDYKCLVIEGYQILLDGIRDVEQVAAFSYKLRSPASQNVLPNGGYGIKGERRTRLRRRVIWASSCES